MLQNGAFSDGWETLPAITDANFLKNQRPHGWQLSWVAIGESLYDDPNSKSGGIPECVHKLNEQLPENERRDGRNALILAGNAVYKTFSANAPFGTTLSQTVTGLEPHSTATLTVPIQVHLHGETDAYGAESGVWVNDIGGWVNGFDMGDRQWYEHKITFTVPANGEAEIVIRVKSKWPKGKDFFFDKVTLEAETAVIDDGNVETKTVFLRLPPGVQIKQGVSNQANVVEVNAGPGVEIEVVQINSQ